VAYEETGLANGGGSELSVSEFLGRLNGVKKQNNGSWKALCPAHDDNNPSLSVNDHGGKLLVHCHAGCSFEQVLAAIKSPPSVLGIHSGNGNRNAGSMPAPRRVVDTYTYTDANGEPLYDVLRYDPRDFKVRRTEGGKHVYVLGGTKLVPYRLPEVIQAVAAGKTIYVVEGEKDVDALMKAGAVATCNPFGAGKWRSEFSEYLREADVIVIADKDRAGWDHARDVATSFRGVARSLDVRQAAVGKDAYDHLAAGKSLHEFEHADVSVPVPAIYVRNGNGNEKPPITPIRLGEFLKTERPPMEWVLDGLLLRGGLSLLCAKPKVGKSTLARNLALCVARGEPFIGREVARCKVLYLALEEHEDMVRDHFERMGATDEDDVYMHCGPAMGCLEEVVSLITEEGYGMVVIDPLFRFVRIRDEAKYGESSDALDSVLRAARDTNCHLLLSHHIGKAATGTGEDYLGSTALYSSVDTLMNMAKKEDGIRTFSGRGRVPEFPETVVTLDVETGRVSAGDELRAVRRDETRQDILTALTAAGCMTRDEIQEECGIQRQKLTDELKALCREGLITCEGAGRRGSPHTYSLPSAETLFTPVSGNGGELV